MKIHSLSKLLAVLALGVGLSACAASTPPRPAMQPLAVAGNFGFTDRKIDADTIEVTYRGAEVSVNSRNARNDTRLEAEKLKVRDLALLHGAKLAKEQGAASVRVASERVDSDVDVNSQPRCRPSPFWGPPGFWGHGYYGHGYYGHGYYGWPGPYYDCYESRWAKARATAVLTLDLLPADAPKDETAQPVGPTIERLEKTYAGATYP
ncbi:hypothetical protein [Dongia sp.]|uniref:CC0125/CC1285 family lipoprotein n=1 Tax=Dongia sp. TaxID=1977262 RepID=UPI0035B3FC50